VIDYYARVSEAIVPHLKGRPLTLRRFPNGVSGGSFFEKRCPEHRPDWVKTATVLADEAGEIAFCLCQDKATLAWMAQLAALELHPSLAKAKDVDRPTVVAFDLDPGPPANVTDCCKVALELRKLFEGLGLQSFAKTSGSKGLQVYVPLNTKVGYPDTRPFAHAIALLLEKRHPKKVVSKMTKSLRRGKVFVDWSQNHRHKTTVAVYSLRAKDRPTVSTPLTWDEIEAGSRKRSPDALAFQAKQVLKRLDEHGDLFEPALKLRQQLPQTEAIPG